MPEGHTLKRLANHLTEAFAGTRVRVSSPQGRFATEAAGLDGDELVVATSAGKHLFIEFGGDRFIHIHLGLIGHFDLHHADEPALPQGQVRLRLARGTTQGWVWADLRGATRCDLVTGADVERVRSTLGADPLVPGATPDAIWEKVRRSSKPIGELLMDQKLFAGIGNVYRAEVLFRQRIHPRKIGKTLQRQQFRAIWNDLVELMAEGVVTGRIDTVRPEHTPEAMGRPPRVDDHGGEVYVYRRTDQPCHVCGSIVRTEVMAGRNSFWCPRCQRAPRVTRGSDSPVTA